jgi:hypothetical protein
MDVMLSGYTAVSSIVTSTAGRGEAAIAQVASRAVPATAAA